MRRRVIVSRSIAGPVLIKFGDGLNGFQWSMTDTEAITFCDALRRVIEAPTQGQPKGSNVVVLSLATVTEETR